MPGAMPGFYVYITKKEGLHKDAPLALIKTRFAKTISACSNYFATRLKYC